MFSWLIPNILSCCYCQTVSECVPIWKSKNIYQCLIQDTSQREVPCHTQTSNILFHRTVKHNGNAIIHFPSLPVFTLPAIHKGFQATYKKLYITKEWRNGAKATEDRRLGKTTSRIRIRIFIAWSPVWLQESPECVCMSCLVAKLTTETQENESKLLQSSGW